MRVLFVIHQFLPRYVTGTEQYVRSLAQGMINRGHDVTVMALEPETRTSEGDEPWFDVDEVVDGIPVRRFGLDSDSIKNRALADYNNPLAVRMLRRFVDEQGFDLVHVFHLRFIGAEALGEFSTVGLPVVVNLMDFWFLCPRFTLLRNDSTLCDGPPEGGWGCVACAEPDLAEEIERLGMTELIRDTDTCGPPRDHIRSEARRARALVGRKERLLNALDTVDAIVAPSKFLQSMFERNGLKSDAVRHIPYGVDPRRLGDRRKVWSKAPPDGSGEKAAPLEIGFVGSLTEHKGVHTLIEAVRSLEGERWHLHIHGSPDTHPEYVEDLHALAGGDPRITFHGVFRPDDLGLVLLGLDLVVVPSLWYENTPFSVLEAKMMGLPVIASDLGGISESIEDGRDGFLFEAGNNRALAGLLEQLVEDPSQIGELQLGGGCRTLEDNLDDFEELYSELLDSRVASPSR